MIKVIKATNTNIPVWSMLDGDHALKSGAGLLSKKLVEEPDFSSVLENKLRTDVFRSTRDWIYQPLKNSSVCIISYTFEDLLTFNTCFTDVTYEKFLDNYHLGHLTDKGFAIQRKTRPDLEKTPESIAEIKKRMAALTKSLERQAGKDLLSKIDNPKYLNSKNCWLATNRALLMKPRDSSKVKIMDATHRLIALGLFSKTNKEKTPEKLYGFYWEETE
jgi:hypothetical protein